LWQIQRVWMSHYLLRIFWSTLSLEENVVSNFVCRKNVSTQNNPPSRVKTPQRTISFSDLDWCVWKTSTSLLQNVFPSTFVRLDVEETRENTLFQSRASTTAAEFRIHLDELGRMINMKRKVSSTGMGSQGNFFSSHLVSWRWKISKKSLLINTVQRRTTKLFEKRHLFKFAGAVKEQLEFPKYQYSLFIYLLLLWIHKWVARNAIRKSFTTRAVRKRLVEFEAKSLMSWLVVRMKTVKQTK
jgi:hypothetical protein